MAVISLITGAPGTGKSYYVVSRIKSTLEALPSVRIRTNLPLKLEEWGTLKERVEFIGGATWRGAGSGGPWEVEDWRDVLFVLDECHNFVCEPRMQRWHDWLGECRHRGVYGVWLITQSSKKVPQLADVGLWVELQRPEEFRGKLTGIPLGVFWQWLSYLRGKRYSLACAYEYLDEKRRRHANKVQWLAIHPEIYRLYNSYSTPEKGGLSGACMEPWQSGFKALALYSLSEAWFPLALRVALCFLLWIGMQALSAIPQALMSAVEPGRKTECKPERKHGIEILELTPGGVSELPATSEKKPVGGERQKAAAKEQRERLSQWLKEGESQKEREKSAAGKAAAEAQQPAAEQASPALSFEPGCCSRR